MRSTQETLGLRKAGGGVPRWLRARLLSRGLASFGDGDNPGRPIPGQEERANGRRKGREGKEAEKWRETASKNQTNFRFSWSGEGKRLMNRCYCYYVFFFFLLSIAVGIGKSRGASYVRARC